MIFLHDLLQFQQIALSTASLHIQVKLLPYVPSVQNPAEDILEDDLCICPCQVHRHEPLSIVEEVHFALTSWFDISPPSFRPCSAR